MGATAGDEARRMLAVFNVPAPLPTLPPALPTAAAAAAAEAAAVFERGIATDLDDGLCKDKGFDKVAGGGEEEDVDVDVVVADVADAGLEACVWEVGLVVDTASRAVEDSTMQPEMSQLQITEATFMLLLLLFVKLATSSVPTVPKGRWEEADRRRSGTFRRVFQCNEASSKSVSRGSVSGCETDREDDADEDDACCCDCCSSRCCCCCWRCSCCCWSCCCCCCCACALHRDGSLVLARDTLL